MNVSLVLTSAVHVPERKAQFDKLKASIQPSSWAAIHEETEKSPNWQWSGNAWDWAANQDTIGTVFLQEDIDVAPDLEARIKAIVECKPDDLIGIHCAHPGARRAYLDGYRWAETRDGLIGVAYYVPTADLREIVQWRIRDLRPRAYERISEDCLLDIYAMCTGKRILHPLPSPVRHKIDMRSTYNNDEHLLRMTQVTWEDEERLGMAKANYAASGIAKLGEFYQALPYHLMDLLEDKAEAKRLLQEILGAGGPEDRFRRFFMQVRGAT